MNNKKKTLLLVFLISRLGFIFFDGVFNKEKTAENIVYFKNMGVTYKETKQHNAAPKENKEISDNIAEKIQKQKNYAQDIKTLQYIYEQEKSPEIIKEIIKKHAQNYNFNEARKNIEILQKNSVSIDKDLFFYIYLNSNNINITHKESIKNILPILDEAVQN